MNMKAAISPSALSIAVFFIVVLGALPYASTSSTPREDPKMLELRSRGHESNSQNLRGREEEASGVDLNSAHDPKSWLALDQGFHTIISGDLSGHPLPTNDHTPEDGSLGHEKGLIGLNAMPGDVGLISASPHAGYDDFAENTKKSLKNHESLFRSYSRQTQQIGSLYFRQAGQSIVGVDGTDQDSFGRSISMSDNGMMLAVSGNLVVIPEEEFVAFVDLYQYDEDLNTWENLQANITTSKIVNEADVEVFLSGNGMRLAIASVYKEDSSGDSFGVVTVYENDGTAWKVIGTPVIGGFHGDRPGLKISMSYTGDRLVVGSRYYTDTSDNTCPKVHAGRARVFKYELGDWAQLGSDLVGDSEADYAGSSVALTPDGMTLAVGATGDDSLEENTGRVKVYIFNTINQEWDQRGNEITGESEDDESGFSIAIAKNGIRVAVGAIYNDGNDGDLRHSGHVRVYDYKSAENVWEQIGSDIDGDHGSIYDGNYFHVGDAFGFSVAMSTDGNKLAIGAPFYSKNRLSGYYGGVAKLYEFVSNQWSQVAYDLNVTDTDATSGYSVALSGNGGRFAIGIPSPDMGMVVVYDQYEVSNFPSLPPSTSPSDTPSSSPTPQPSLVPSNPPSDIPTKQPSTSPSNQPSFIPSRYPTISPSATPSNGPTAQVSSRPSHVPSYQPSDIPSSQPTNVPSMEPFDKPSHDPSSRPSDIPSDLPSVKPSISPSLEPTNKPSQDPSSLPSGVPSAPPLIQPSNIPSLKPSANPSIEPSSGPSARPSVYPSDQPSIIPSRVPSSKPSIAPSFRPSVTPSIAPTALPSTLPSQNPTSIADRTFKIKSSYSLFEKFSDEDTAWCMQASGFGDDSTLNVRQCSSKPSQLWFLDSSRNLRLRKFPSFCVVYEGKKLHIRSCDEAKPFEIDPENHSISVMKRNSKKFYICVDTFRAFSKLALMKEGIKNSSWNTWHIEYEVPSTAPSISPFSSSVPSPMPSTAHSTTPSLSPRGWTPEAGYELVYSLELPVSPSYQSGRPQYLVDNHLAINSFSRIAYFLELDDKFVWVSMDAFTSDIRKIGVPCLSLECGDGNIPTIIQQVVSNMTVVSNVPGLSGFGLSGNIEFWPYNYGRKNEIGIEGARDDVYDFGDQYQDHEPRGYGSMQIHVRGGDDYARTAFAFNNFNVGQTADLGIGNGPYDHPDWTYAHNANTYNVRNLKIYTSKPSSDSCIATFSNGYMKTSQSGESITISAEANGGVGYPSIRMVVTHCPLSAIMHLWGAGGGGSRRSDDQYGGRGGYSTGLYTFQPGIYYIVVGGAGEGGSQSPHDNNAYQAYNTGGGRVAQKTPDDIDPDGAGGGGLTGVFSDDVAHSNSIIIAGGGGGGSGDMAYGGGGGGLSGGDASNCCRRGGGGGKQNSGGSRGWDGYDGSPGSELQGGNGGGYGAGGGGGYYGGGGGAQTGPGAGGGGSGYIGGVVSGESTSGSDNASNLSDYREPNVGLGGSSGGRGGGGQITFVFS